MDNSLQVSEEAADPEMREVAADAYESLLRVKGHASSSDLAGSVAEEVRRAIAPPAAAGLLHDVVSPAAVGGLKTQCHGMTLVREGMQGFTTSLAGVSLSC